MPLWHVLCILATMKYEASLNILSVVHVVVLDANV